MVVSSTNSATCPIFTTPAIEVTVFCPTNPVGQGGYLTYSGTVSNAGNITLTNIVVTNNWPFSFVVFTVPSLAPGATTNFTGHYYVPLNCCQAWLTVVASGQGCDGFTVTDTDSHTCAVFTSPGIVVTKECATRRRFLRPGELLTYSGTVSNTGNITLFSVTVVDNQPNTNALVLGPIILAPGELATFAGSYVVPVDFCGNDTATASGFDLCSGALVTNSVTAICPIAHNPRIGVTKQCPELPTPHGSNLTFFGTVTNLGDVTLVNVYVVNDQPSNNTPVSYTHLRAFPMGVTGLNREKRTTVKQFLADLKDFHDIDAHALKPKTKLDKFWKLEAAEIFAHFRANKLRLKDSDEEKIRARFQKAKDELVPLETQIAFTDQLIDEIVYRLYGLTEAEIKIVSIRGCNSSMVRVA